MSENIEIYDDEEPEIDNHEPEVQVDPVVDKIEYADDWAKGYLKGKLVIEFTGVSDINAIVLYNADGERVTPTLVKPVDPGMPPDLSELEKRVDELEDALEIMMGGQDDELN